MFTVLDSFLRLPPQGQSHVYLVSDSWDDWFSYQTMFTMYVYDDSAKRHVIGKVKIGQAGLMAASSNAPVTPGYRYPQLPENFQSLANSAFFSLGQDEYYYTALWALPKHICDSILYHLADCARDLAVFNLYRSEPVMQRSLLRAIPEENVRNRLHRLAHGDAALTRFEFQYTLPVAPLEAGQVLPPPPPTISFLVEPNSYPPSNVHVLVGRNGAGKTRCIQSLVNSVLGRQSALAPQGLLQRLGQNQDQWNFAGLVSVSFSAFDEFEAPPPPTNLTLRAGFVGLRSTIEVDGIEKASLKTKDELANDFVESFKVCREEPRRTRWLTAVRTLGTDPLFAEVDVERFLQVQQPAREVAVAHAFKKLSSGHAIVLLTTTRLVELVDERTLVLLDEPEGHLHPPLLSAFVRAISDLLVSRNGVALICTHSPVVLQEVPRNCVWMLRRTRTIAVVERPSIETFGESAGVLTREVFGLEVSNSGFHKLVADVANAPTSTVEDVSRHFGNQLGSEARVLARSLVTLKSRRS